MLPSLNTKCNTTTTTTTAAAAAAAATTTTTTTRPSVTVYSTQKKIIKKVLEGPRRRLCRTNRTRRGQVCGSNKQ